jgi:hypothetical protein
MRRVNDRSLLCWCSDRRRDGVEMSITIDKLVRVLNAVAVFDGVVTARGNVGCTSGGEIELDFVGQLPRAAHDYLLGRGFVQGGNPGNPTSYVYRP